MTAATVRGNRIGPRSGRRPMSDRVSGSAPAQLAVAVERVGALLADGLDRDVVGAGVEMLLDPCGGSRRVTVADEGVDERLAAALGEVVLAPPEAAQIGEVVAQLEVRLGHDPPGEVSGLVRVGLDHDLLLRREQGVLAEQFACLAGVLGCGQIRMRTRAAAPGQRQHLRAKSGERTLVLRGVFLVEDIEYSTRLRWRRRPRAAKMYTAPATANQMS